MSGVDLVAIGVVISKLSGPLHMPGSAATILVIAFFAAANLTGLDVIGAYVGRAFTNRKWPTRGGAHE